MHGCMYVCMYVCMCLCVCMHVYVDVWMFVCMYIHIYIYMFAKCDVCVIYVWYIFTYIGYSLKYMVMLHKLYHILCGIIT